VVGTEDTLHSNEQLLRPYARHHELRMHRCQLLNRSVPCPCRIPRNPMIVRFQYVSPNSWRACIGHRLEASWTGQLSAHQSGSPWSGHEGNLHCTHGYRAHGRSGLSKRYAKTMDTTALVLHNCFYSTGAFAFDFWMGARFYAPYSWDCMDILSM
jgi:hypothetical protein